MRIVTVLIALALLGAVTNTASGQALNISDLLAMLGEGGGLTGDVGGSPAAGPGGGVVTGGPAQVGGDGRDGADEEALIPQQNLRAARSRRPGLWINAGIAHYQERTANLGVVGPSQVPVPEVPEETRVMPTIINDLLGSLFDMVNVVVNGLNVFTQLQSGLQGGGGFDLQSLLQQFLSSQSSSSKEVVPESSGPLPEQGELRPHLEPEASQAVVIPPLPGQ